MRKPRYNAMAKAREKYLANKNQKRKAKGRRQTMSIPREMIDTIEEAFNKSIKYDEIVEIMGRDYSDGNKLNVIQSIISFGGDKVKEIDNE